MPCISLRVWPRLPKVTHYARRGVGRYARCYAGARIREGMRNARHVWWNLGRGGLALPDTFYSSDSPWISSVFRRCEHLRVVRWVAVSCAVIRQLIYSSLCVVPTSSWRLACLWFTHCGGNGDFASRLVTSVVTCKKSDAGHCSFLR